MSTTTLAAFCRAMFDACARAAAGDGDWWAQVRGAARRLGSLRVHLGPLLDVGLQLSGPRAADEQLDRAVSLPQRVAARTGTPVVVIMDEFQDAAKLHADFYRVLRRYATGTDPVSFLFLGSRAGLLRNLFVKTNQPLYRKAFELTLPTPPRARGAVTWSASSARWTSPCRTRCSTAWSAAPGRIPRTP